MFKQEIDTEKIRIIEEMKREEDELLNEEVSDVKDCDELEMLNKKDEYETNKQFKYQRFLRKYSNTIKKSKHTNGILIYHGVGTGKTRTALSMMQEICNIKNNENAVILCPASLIEDPWLKELANFTQSPNWNDVSFNVNQVMKRGIKNKKSLLEDLSDNYRVHIISHNSSDVYKIRLLNEVKGNNGKVLHNSTIIIDEIHNVITSITNKILENPNKPLPSFYTKLVERGDSTLIGLSATPLVNKPFELAVLANLIRGVIENKPFLKFELDKNTFTNMFFESNDMEKLINERMLSRRLFGIVSYYEHSNNDLYAKMTHDVVRVKLSLDQTEGYIIAQKIAEKLQKMAKSKQAKGSIDYSLSQLYFVKASNIVFPKWLSEGDEIMKLRKNNQPIDFDYPLPIDRKKERYIRASSNIQSKESKFILKALDNDTKPLNLSNELINISKKFYHILTRIFLSSGPVIVYSRLNGLYGIATLELVLQQNGFLKYDEFNRNSVSLKYTLFTGIDKNPKNIKAWNMPQNSNGEIIKVILITGAGKEGISLKHVRQIHLLEPWWNMMIQKQVSGRGLRMCSHSDVHSEDFVDLRLNDDLRSTNEKVVNVFHYIAYCNKKRKTGEESLTEFKNRLESGSFESFVWKKAKQKEFATNLLLDIMQKASIDCTLPYSKNMTCFNTNISTDFAFHWNTTDNVTINEDDIADTLIVNNQLLYEDDFGNVFENLDPDNNESLLHADLNLNKIGMKDVLNSDNIILNDLYQVDNVINTMNSTKEIRDDILPLSRKYNIEPGDSIAIVITDDWNSLCLTVLDHFKYVFFAVEKDGIKQAYNEVIQFSKTDAEPIFDTSKMEFVNDGLRRICSLNNISCVFVSKFAEEGPMIADKINSVFGKVDKCFIETGNNNLDFYDIDKNRLFSKIFETDGWSITGKIPRNSLTRAIAKGFHNENARLILYRLNTENIFEKNDLKKQVRLNDPLVKLKKISKSKLKPNLSQKNSKELKKELSKWLEMLFKDKFWM